MPGPAALNLYGIPAHRPFLDSLAAGVLARAGDAPDALSRVTLLLPTRRAARALREAFLRAAGGRALLLPRMRALAGLSTEDADELDLPALLDLPPAVEPLTRQAVLAGMVGRLPRRLGGARSPEQAWLLAGEMARLFDEIALEEKDPALLRHGEEAAFTEAWLARFDTLAPAEHAQHWQITTQLLRAVVQDWTGWLQGEGLLDIGVRRVLALTEQARAWRDSPPADPVIAAGIGAGGTIPAAAALLKLLCRTPQGAVVVQGTADPEDGLWDAIAAAPTHPFCGLGRLLAQIDAGPAEILPWDAPAAPLVPEARATLLARAMRPADGLGCWTQADPARWTAARDGLRLLRAADSQQEAVATALLLRGALETPGARAALVTPDRMLARRVAAELARHGITADDSAGEPLAITPAAAFLRLIGTAFAQGFAPAALLALAKHPLCAGGMERIAWLGAIRRLERTTLRGARPAPGLAGLRRAAKPDERTDALLDALERCFAPLTALDGAARPAAALLDAHMAVAEALASTPDLAGGLRLYAGEEGEPLARHLHDLATALAEHPPVGPREWPDLFESCLSGPVAPSLRSIRRGGQPHPRVEILGLLEARLLSFDTVVLGALEEAVWPLVTDPGPWMSRPMRKEFGLPEPESRIGRVAADFFYAACAAPNAVLSAARRRDGAPTVPARWLTRLEIFLRGQDRDLALDRSPAAEWAAALDMPAGPATPCARPAPRPGAAHRPRKLSVSDTRLLIADPYAFYAKTVLRLFPLDPLDQDVGAIEYGNLVHAALHGFLTALGTAWPGEDAAIAAWEKAADAALAEYESRPAIVAFWGPRLGNIGRFVVDQERDLRERGALAACLSEVKGEMTLTLPEGAVLVQARADRIDRLADGGWRVVDYKTGETPTGPKLASGLAPQLPMEALILAHGGFPTADPGSTTTEMLYWRLTGGEVPGEVRPMPLADKDGTPLMDLAEDRLRALAARYLLGDAPFASRPHPARSAPGGDYDHLARIAEWSAAEDDGA